MAPKRAAFLCYGDDEACSRTMKYITDAGILVDYRDISKQPLSEYEVRELLGNLAVDHFLNVLAPSYEKHKLDERPHNREELIKLLAQDHTLFRKPIIRTARLITVGTDMDRISEMLQIVNGKCEQGRSDNERANNMRRPARAGHSA